MFRSIATAFTALALSIPAIAADGDGVQALCLDRKSEDVCRCATERLEAERGADDFSVYDAVGIRFAGERKAGKDYVAAWDAASAATAADIGISIADLRKQTNDIGRAHAKAIRACSGAATP